MIVVNIYYHLPRCGKSCCIKPITRDVRMTVDEYSDLIEKAYKTKEARMSEEEYCKFIENKARKGVTLDK